MTKNDNLKVLLMLIMILIYFFSTILANYFQQYEYIFFDINNIKKYQLFSSRVNFYAYIDLEDNMYTEGEPNDFRIKEVYEDKNYFIGYDFEKNYKTNEIEKRYYIVIDKNKAIMEIYNEQDFKENYKNIDDNKFTNIYTFLKRKGTKIGMYR
ncbi:hypothetical protein [Fusobacterium animalis]|uniref:hypothetical protein n=1 Tax=Fusobacterium animalis TaxID=76859 RepID=UPI0030CEDA1B